MGGVLLAFILCFPTFASSLREKSFSSRISSEVPARALKRVVDSREVVASAILGGEKDGKRPYRFYLLGRVHANLRSTLSGATEFDVYEELIPFVDRSEFNTKTRVLKISGGIFGYQMRSQIRFQKPIYEIGRARVPYRVVGGHFKGMTGEMVIEEESEGYSLLFLYGRLTGKKWPPAFVVERGAEVVMSLTAKRMRDRVEKGEFGRKEVQGDSQRNGFPKPRRNL